jgi:hypothetical protein
LLGEAYKPQLTATSPEFLTSVDKLYRRRRANIAFNTPRELNLKQEAQIKLLLDTRKSTEELKRQISELGEKEGATIEISNRMQARLTGSSFSITAITPEVQAVSDNDSTIWKWEVKPLESGSHTLHLTLSMMLKVDGESTERTVESFDRSIDVNVKWSESFVDFVAKNWQWLWAAILLPAVGWLINRFRSKKRV